MSTMTKILLSLFLLCPLLGDTANQYSKYRQVSGTLNRITFRQPASGARSQQLKFVWFKCSVECTWVISKGGTVSGGTADDVVQINGKGRDNVSEILHDATVTGATTLNSETLAAGGSLSLDGHLLIPATNTQEKFTVALTSSSSGTLTVYVEYDEP